MLRLLIDYSSAFLQSVYLQKAISYSIEGQKLGSEFSEVRLQDYSTALFNLGRSFYSQNDFERAILISDELISFTEKNIPKYVQLLAYYNLRAISLSGAKRFDEAASQFNELIKLMEERGLKDYFYRTAVMNLGVCYELMGELDVAEKYLHQALAYEKSADPKNNINYVDRYKHFGQYYNSKELFSESLLYYDSALRSGIPSYKEKLLQFPTDSLLKPTYNVLTVLKNKAIMLNRLNGALKKDSINLLVSALDYVEKTQDYLMKNREELEASQGKLFLSDDFKTLYEVGIDAAYQLIELGVEVDQNFEKAMRLSGLSKSILFLEQSGELGAIQDSELPISLKQEVFDLKTNIDRLESQFYDLTFRDIGSDSVRAINANLMALYRNIESIEDSLFNNNSQSKFLTSQISLTKLYRYLERNKSIGVLEYFVAKDFVYIFGLSSQKKKLQKIPISSDFNSAFASLIDEITNRPEITNYSESIRKFKKSSSEVYGFLLKGVEEVFGEEVQSLVIIPDEQLSKLPFEVLLSENTEDDYFYDLDYLLKRFKVSYSLSSHLVASNNSKTKTANKRLLGMGFSGNIASETRAEFGDLPGTEEEIKHLKSKIDGDYFLGDRGTKQRFLEVAKEFDLLHLAIHGQSDAANRYESRLVFNGNDNILKTSDLYVAGLNSRVAVLSACESGVGEINRGEGTFSIARGFALVGVPTVVMSLWKVNDNAASELMVKMYEMFSNGSSITESLTETKRSYLYDSDEYTSHPYYWSAFVTLGEDVYLEEDRISTKTLALLGFLLFSLIVMIIVYRLVYKRKGA